MSYPEASTLTIFQIKFHVIVCSVVFNTMSQEMSQKLCLSLFTSSARHTPRDRWCNNPFGQPGIDFLIIFDLNHLQVEIGTMYD